MSSSQVGVFCKSAVMQRVCVSQKFTHLKSRCIQLHMQMKRRSLTIYQSMKQKTKFLQKLQGPNVANQKSTQKFSHSVVLRCGLGTISLGIPLIYKINTTQCHAEEKQNTRLVGIKDESKKTDPAFQWREFFKLLLPEILYLLASVVAAFAVAIVNIKIPLLLGDVVNIVSKFTTENAGNYMAVIREPATRLVTLYGIQAVLTSCYIALLSAVGERVACRMRKKLFESLIKQDIEFFDRHRAGELINRLTSDVQDFKSSFKLCISQGLRSMTQIIGCVGSLLMISPALTGGMVVIVPTIVLVGHSVGSVLRKLSKEAQAQIARATAVADEAIGNVRTVRAFAMEPKETELYSQEVDKSCYMSEKLGLGIGIFQGLANFALNGIILSVLYTGGYLMSVDKLTPGDLMSFLVATQTIQRSLAQMSLLFGQAVRGASAGARAFEYMMLQPSIPLSGGMKIPCQTMEGAVEFRNVSFRYPTREDQVVLEDFNLKIPSGRTVALCGLSGGGKSTVASLLERFYEVEQGHITIDGIDIKNLDPSWLRGRAIGFINQEPVLFATSIMENIRYGRPDAKNIEVIEAATLANAHSFITEFPEGYNTVLGERGVTVSGGQKQRIAIARALLKNPSILILDEATSALDAESERVVQEALDNVSKGRTVLVIAHRLSTIQNADIIAVISGGRVAEVGRHDELKKKQGLYWELIKQQQIEDEVQEMLGGRHHWDSHFH